MKVVILCGGRGTRLKEETEYKPKPLVTVGGMPILWHIMKIYSHYGFNDFILCLGYKGELIKDYFLNFEELTNDFTLDLRSKEKRVVHHNKKSLENWRITFANTGQESQTGTRLYKIRHLLNGEDFLLTYGDGVGNVDIPKTLRLHKDTGAVITVTGIYPKLHWGILETKNNMAVSFKEKPTAEHVVNGGFKVCNTKIFDYLSADPDCILEQGPMRQLAQEGKMAVYEHDGFWHSMDTYKQYEELNAMWNTGDAPWKIWE